MALLNLRNREIQLKIVYYGPGKSGKTTNLFYIYNKCRERIRSKMINLDTFGERTLFFDYLPVDLGKVNGFNVIVQLYTVPGQEKYDATRKLLLNGVDGIVFVADLMEVRRKKNILSLNNLSANLKKYNKNIFKIPLIFQFNKVDLAHNCIPILQRKTLCSDLNRELMRPYYVTSAIRGTNVIKTLKHVIKLTYTDLKNSMKFANSTGKC
jgi:signal recognition particle receptor subunit beta